ncbi:MAG: hypothetical protein GX659_04565 [Myxococcales bacterium]|nr:hypothetical protein [Myxococcales bacterium]
MNKLSDIVKIKRRYSRSVNLERDGLISESVLGYVLTPKACDLLERFATSYVKPNTNRAWTVTGVYGTGKSAFAHFLSALCSSKKEIINKNALAVYADEIGKTNEIYNIYRNELPERGFLKAVVTARYESIGNTLVRALYDSVPGYFSRRKPKCFSQIKKTYALINKDGDYRCNTKDVLNYICEISAATKGGLLLIIDELGKCLEWSANMHSVDDLYLLQQIAELPSREKDPKVFLLGILHQSFSDYAYGLAKELRNEWSKIQGRFEDVVFTDSHDQLIRVLGKAIEQKLGGNGALAVNKWANDWKKVFKKLQLLDDISEDSISKIYPIHPLAALILPQLCNKYAQNDRTLFTFLASREPHSFSEFLNSYDFNLKAPATLKLFNLYDYFVEVAASSIAVRPEFQRWSEINSRIQDLKHVDQDKLCALKTIGILNLISTTGLMRASKQMVINALVDSPTSAKENDRWSIVLETMEKDGLVVWRRQIDELRLWEGSDFNIEQHLVEELSKIKSSVADLLNEYYSLKPVIAQRHSYQTGTLRFFERRFFDDLDKLKDASRSSVDSDGLIAYWLGNVEMVKGGREFMKDGRPLLILTSENIRSLENATCEYIALGRLENDSYQLKQDGVARKEVRNRLAIAKNFLDRAVAHVFDFTQSNVSCIRGEERHVLKGERDFKKLLSDVCDYTFKYGPTLKNELINRRTLTAQGSTARRILINAILNNSGVNRLGLEGHGPEVSMYESVLENTGIVTADNGYCLKAPRKDSGIFELWSAITNFFLEAVDSQSNFSDLHDKLCDPPYGANKPIIQILIAVVYAIHKDIIGIFKNGSFMPELSSDDFELIEKKPEIYSVKHFEITGMRGEVFKDFNAIFYNPSSGRARAEKSLLSVVKPFIRFIKSMPPYTLKTKSLSGNAIRVRDAILNATEPDVLLFTNLPKACGFKPINAKRVGDKEAIKSDFKEALEGALKEIQLNYENLLSQCRAMICSAYEVPEKSVNSLRDILVQRSKLLAETCFDPNIKSFIMTTLDDSIDDHRWLESVVMIISDKPISSWEDEDLLKFKENVKDHGRRYLNLETLQRKIVGLINQDVIARRVVVTKPDGKEINKTLWVTTKDYNDLSRYADKILNESVVFEKNKMQSALLAVLAEKIFDNANLSTRDE